MRKERGRERGENERKEGKKEGRKGKENTQCVHILITSKIKTA